MNRIETMDENIVSLESEIVRVQAKVVAMKQVRNSHTPVCRLPVEILSRIILWTQSQSAHGVFDHRDLDLFDFEHDQGWKKLMLTCARVYDVCMTTPQLWAYVDLTRSIKTIERHMSLSGAVPLILNWIPNQMVDRYNPQDRDEDTYSDMAIDADCFRRTRAAQVSFYYCSREEDESITQVVHRSAPELSTLHIALHESLAWSFLESLKLYPALVELSIKYGTLWGSTVDTRLNMLSRLNLEHIRIGINLQPMIGLLLCTPHLKELSLNKVRYEKAQNDPDSDTPPQRILSLLDLRKIRLAATSPIIICSFLLVLSLHTPSLRELVVDIEYTPGRRPNESTILPSVFEMIMRRWGRLLGAQAPLAPAELEWNTNPGSLSWLEIRSAQYISAPVLRLRTVYQGNQTSLYRRYGINIGTIQIKKLVQSQHLPSPWTSFIDRAINGQVPGNLTQLIFDDCCEGVPGLKDWIQTQRAEGRIIQKVAFKACHHPPSMTFPDYLALKESGLIHEVLWED